MIYLLGSSLVVYLISFLIAKLLNKTEAGSIAVKAMLIYLVLVFVAGFFIGMIYA